MNTPIFSTFSFKFEEFKNDVTKLFLEDICKYFLTAYEFAKVSENKAQVLMRVTDLEKLGAALEEPLAKEWDKKNKCKDTVYTIEPV